MVGLLLLPVLLVAVLMLAVLSEAVLQLAATLVTLLQQMWLFY